MEQKPFTIIVPTRERADILIHTLRTCTMQDYDRLSILVSDNYSQDDTRAVVDSLQDPRIRYINPGKRLSMAHHYEFALSNVQEGFATILGDDDGFLPGAVETSNQLLNETGLEAINMNYYHDFYFWPNHPVKRQANMLKVSFEKGYEILETRREIGKALNCDVDYLRLPMIYSSFVSINAINKIKAITNQFFRSQCPDVYSGIAITHVLDKYVKSNKRLRLAGISAKSTGTSGLFNHDNAGPMAQFNSESNIPFHEKIKPTESTASISYIIAESFLQSFDAGLNADKQKSFNFIPFIKTAIKEANSKFRAKHDEIIATTRYIAEKNNLDREAVERLIKQGEERKINIIGYDLKRYAHPFLLLDGSVYGVENIYDACLLHEDVYKSPANYFFAKSTWAFMGQLLFGELGARYK
ncbi:hypothetical protein GCM10028818_28310 [Spirosoma horti]